MAAAADSFVRLGPAIPASPVILSVPHAGRVYPAALRPLLRVPLATLMALEDRHADTVAHAARGQEMLFVQHAPRAWIDLNRGEQERDPLIDSGADPRMQPMAGAKLRNGLGLVPRRVLGQDIWLRRLRGEEVTARIAGAHRPYHAALSAALAAARARFGVAVLLDIHSMPPLGPEDEAARLVFGDRFGATAAARFVARLEAVAEGAGLRHALNAPYAGGHILARHAAPRRGIHAIQLELDRRLYLDGALVEPGDGLAATARVLRQMIDSLTDEALSGGLAQAAE